jgi:hypothetical protein
MEMLLHTQIFVTSQDYFPVIDQVNIFHIFFLFYDIQLSIFYHKIYISIIEEYIFEDKIKFG